MSAQALTSLHMVPQKQLVDAGYYVIDILQAEVSASQPCAVRQYQLGFDEEKGARDVAAKFSAVRCTGAHAQRSPAVVPRELGGLLGQKHMTRELIRSESNQKYLGNTESGARRSRAPCQSSAAHGASLFCMVQ